MVTELHLSEVLGEFARTMVTDFPIQAILDHLVERIVDIMPVSAAGVTLISPGVDPRYIAASSSSALRYEKLQTELGEGPCLTAYYDGTAIAVPDLRVEGRFPRFTPRALESGLAAVFTFPLRHGDRRLGALDLYREVPGPLSAEAMTAAQTLADVVSAYLINSQARSDLEQASDQSRETALHDGLTGLPNRTLMLERLEHALLRSRRSNLMSTVIFVDIDRFKTVNDSFGHAVGDELLIAMARRLSEVVRPSDTVARPSGDEFVILCEDLRGADHADKIVQRLTSALAHPFVLSSVELEVTASVGIALTGQGSQSAAEILHAADMMMYEAKRAGRGFMRVVDLRDQHLVEDRSSLSADMVGVVDRDELRLEYQPIMSTVDGHFHGVEALLRWEHPSRGQILPGVIIPIAERLELISGIGYWALGQALSDQLRWKSQPGMEHLAASVNVSTVQLMAPRFAETLAELLAASATAPKLLTLDITESVFVRDAERALVVLHDLHDIGVRLALDDFGTGYSSLTYLLNFPVDIVKIDREFIAGLGRDPATEMPVSAVIALAHGLDMTVVAEGVETAEQHHELTRLGCDSCQGFYFGRPMAAAGLEALFQRDPSGIYQTNPARAST